jgi:single-strand DNA-binding protein
MKVGINLGSRRGNVPAGKPSKSIQEVVTMSDVNVVVLAGRLCAKPELRFTAQGSPLCNLRLASNKVRGEKKYTTFADIKVFGKLAESVAAHRAVGDSVTVRGSLALSTWEDSETKQKRSRHIIMADEVSYGQRANREGADEVEAPAGNGATEELEAIPF